MELTIDAAADSDGRQLLTLAGSIDLATRGELVKASEAALASAGSKALILDMAGVTFLDSTGIGALVQISNAARTAGVAFSLDRPSERVSRILQLTGLQDRWNPDATSK